MTDKRIKLSQKDCRRIRELYFNPIKAPNGKYYSQRMLAKLFRVSEQTIQNVINKKGRYKNV